MTTIDRLNELLEAERAGVETLSRLFPAATGPEMQKLFEDVRDDEAWSCAGLVQSIRTLGGAISEKKGDFAEKVMGEPTLAARLRLLNRGQGWVVKRLDGLLGEGIPASVSEIRVVDIVGLDKQADGGTHVRTTDEVGRIRVIKTESKGKGNKRIRLEVVDADG